MSEYPDTVYQVLELAEKCVLESEIPRELKEAVRFCIAKKMAWIQPAAFVGHSPGNRLFADRPTVIVNPKPKKETPLSKKFQETMVKNRLLIKDEGEAVLALYRERARLPDYAKSEVATGSAASKSVKKGINGKMLAKIQKDAQGTKECFGWTSSQWAKFLNCSKPTIVNCAAWKQLAEHRDTLKAERARDRRQRKKPLA